MSEQFFKDSREVVEPSIWIRHLENQVEGPLRLSKRRRACWKVNHWISPLHFSVCQVLEPSWTIFDCMAGLSLGPLLHCANPAEPHNVSVNICPECKWPNAHGWLWIGQLVFPSWLVLWCPLPRVTLLFVEGNASTKWTSLVDEDRECARCHCTVFVFYLLPWLNQRFAFGVLLVRGRVYLGQIPLRRGHTVACFFHIYVGFGVESRVFVRGMVQSPGIETDQTHIEKVGELASNSLTEKHRYFIRLVQGDFRDRCLESHNRSQLIFDSGTQMKKCPSWNLGVSQSRQQCLALVRPIQWRRNANISYWRHQQLCVASSAPAVGMRKGTTLIVPR